MKQLTKIQNIIFLLGAILMVVGSGIYIIGWSFAAWIFTVGAIAFAYLQYEQSYDGSNITVKRLRRIQLTGDLFFVLTALLMLEDKYMFIKIDLLYYVQYVHNNWVVILLCAAIIELYTTHRISHELDKEAKKL
mgnify:CR=1 FL=1|jgi:hypothetical protein